MKYAHVIKKISTYQRKYMKMTVRQRKSWYGQWIAWRLRKMTAWCKEIDRNTAKHYRQVGDYSNRES